MNYSIWIPIAVVIAGLLIAVAHYLARRELSEPISMEGMAEDFVEVVSEAKIFAEQMTPIASTIVLGVRQKYLNGEIDFEDLKDEAMEAMKLLFPNVDEAMLDKAVEAAVFGGKLLAGSLWHKKPEPTSLPIGSVELGSFTTNTGDVSA